MKDVIFFDLDGTLTKSEEGIIRCVQYALRELGMPVPAKKDLFYFIGPPLVDSFLTLPGFTEAMALEATALYRKRYTAIGIFENELYPGITDLLEALDEAGFLPHYRSFWPYALFSGNWRCFLRCLPANQKCSHRRGPEPAWPSKDKGTRPHGGGYGL